MPSASTKDGRRLTGYRGDTADNNHIGQIQHHSLYDDDMEDYQPYTTTDDDEVYEEYDEDVDDLQQQQDDDQDDTGSELSIPDPNIDFDMVYALHTFAATVEGQASVVRGDALTLLDDSNSYWWLVKVLKTAEVGYIPAENIETPHERLARLNSHRNIELTRKDIQDAFPTPPSNKLKKKKRVTLAKGVQFQSQIIYGSSDDEEDFEAEFEQWDEKMRSDDSETDDQDSDEDSNDPYNYYDDHNQNYSDQTDLYSPYQEHESTTVSYQQQQQRRSLINTKPINNTSYTQQPNNSNNTHYADPIGQYQQISNDSDIINDPQDHIVRNVDRDTLNLEDETIKISLTPSIARGYDDQQRNSDSSIQSKLKKAAKLEKLLGPSASPEPTVQEQQRRNSKDSNSGKKEKSGIRKFFSRNSSSGGNSKDSKKSKKSATQSSLERQLSGGSNYETASISSQSTGMMSFDRDRQGSLDSSIMSAAAAVQPTQLKIHAGNITDFGHESYKAALIYPSTTALELIHQVIHRSNDDNDDALLVEENTVAYHDYYLIVKTLGGDEFTLVPSDKPLEIFHSLTAHLSTPMPSLKKARRISQLMGSDNTHIGGPTKETMHQQPDQVQFFLFSKTKRIEDGEIQIKVSLFSSRPQQQHYNADQSKRVDKLVKIPSSILIKDAVTLLLEKFHILNGIVAGSTTNDIESLRLDGGDELVKYQLYINRNGQEHLLDTTDKLLDSFGVDQVPPIHYRRNSNPDRSSITVNITPPEKTETYFILKCIDDGKEHQSHHEQQQQQHKKPHRMMMRQDTPMPRQETTPTDGFSQQPLPQYQPQIVLDTRDVMSSPEEAMFESNPVLSSSPDSNQDVFSQLDEAIDTLTPTTPPPMALPLHHHQQQQQQQQQPQLQSSAPPPPSSSPPQKQRPRPESTESMLFCNDFGMNDLMVIIRGAAQLEKPAQPARQSSYQIRSEISEVFKDSQARLDQLEKVNNNSMMQTCHDDS
ncbi:hypothetical protein MAM1_0119c05814 [Mucor ambiguus]|uniref:SH3 domain-containing protein n=1 Tax=Mucor ambiguus TaxID=91626 RepID=A0A0C9MW38_9FUNG|nr:hypothetical protein MAM1_0119c05814 [Mucor ambiguus]